MIDTLKIYDELKNFFGEEGAKKLSELLGNIYNEVINSVTKQEFSELKNLVGELIQAQEKTQERVEELAQAQKKSEERLTRLEEVVEELAQAQKNTEQEIRKLTISLTETRKMVGGLSDTVGYGLEDRAIKALPDILKNNYKIEISKPLLRKILKSNGMRFELNIFGVGKKGGKEIYIIGEAESKLSKSHIDRFIKKVSFLEENKIISKNKFLLMVSYMIEPEIEDYAKRKGIEIIWSYQL
ncbi:MAG: chordopoxvirus fusion protein [Candidatus Omnitrophica bacterium]|nr:chordopoxvirus fusion protein [Candidatus Omnitrophota bacterium]